MGRLVVLLGLAVVLLARPGVADRKASDDATTLACGVILDRAPEAEDIEAVGAQLAALGTAGLEVMFTALRDGRYARADENERVEWQTLRPAHDRAVMSAFGSASATVVKGLLNRRFDKSPTPETRRTALRILVPIIAERDLSFLFALAEPESKDIPLDRIAARLFEEGLTKLLEKNERVLSSLRHMYERSHRDLRQYVVSSVSEVGSDEALVTLSQFLTIDEYLDTFVLTNMGRMARHVTLPADQRVVSRVRTFLRSSSSRSIQEAILVLGKLEDAGSVEAMIRFLENDDRNIRGAAHWALKHVSGLELRADPRRWLLWHKNEQDWWETHAPDVMVGLRSAHTFDVRRAIAVLSQRRNRRHEIAVEITTILTHRDPEVVRQACIALRILDSRSAITSLIPLAEHPVDDVRNEARAALSSLGFDLSELEEDS